MCYIPDPDDAGDLGRGVDQVGLRDRRAGRVDGDGLADGAAVLADSGRAGAPRLPILVCLRPECRNLLADIDLPLIAKDGMGFTYTVAVRVWKTAG